MNDSYWVVQENSKDLFKDKNLYHNSFNTNIASIAFTGYGNYTRTSFKSSPEFTTNGMLAKSWRRIKNNLNTHIPQVTVKLRNDSFNFLGIYV
ncbi:hypothetical protein ACTQVW_11580 [Catenibacterium mitsuokai]|uniref:hypothetical protein n=1 Tax=Catenibacterium mitsuokai TaxID=100886 RepID=UPI003F8DB9A0